MHLNYGILKAIGFKAVTNTGDVSDLYTGLFYRIKDYKVEYVCSVYPYAIGVFKLSADEINEFKAGDLALLPPGFRCPPDAGRVKMGGKVLYMGGVAGVDFIETTLASYVDDNEINAFLEKKYKERRWRTKAKYQKELSTKA